MVKISDDVLPLPVIEGSLKYMFEFYINFFKLRATVDPQAMLLRRLSILYDRKALIGGKN